MTPGPGRQVGWWQVGLVALGALAGAVVALGWVALAGLSEDGDAGAAADDGTTTTSTTAPMTTTSSPTTTATPDDPPGDADDESALVVEEGAAGFCGADGPVESEHVGFTGDGYVNTDNADGAGVDYAIRVEVGGPYSLTFRYSNGASTRPADLLVNDMVMATYNFEPSGDWTNYQPSSSASVTLASGVNTIRLEASSGEGLPNIDGLLVTGRDPVGATCG